VFLEAEEEKKYIYDISTKEHTHTYMLLTDSGSQNISVEEHCFLDVRNSNRNVIQLAQLPNLTWN